MLLSCEGSHRQKKGAPQPEAVSKQPRHGDGNTGEREFSDGENRKGERRQRPLMGGETPNAPRSCQFTSWRDGPLRRGTYCGC